jgi:3-deoxy-D-manno-octulosonate 8-phosphate phosphatase KdsC-like HAD superfamily phosphatase
MFNNPQMQPMGGYYYNGMQPQQIKQQMNVLSDDEIKELMNNQDTFTLALTNRELLQSYCNHRKIGGMGDSYNDLPLLEAVDCSYTFPSSPIELTSKVDKVTPGIAASLEDFLQQ